MADERNRPLQVDDSTGLLQKDMSMLKVMENLKNGAIEHQVNRDTNLEDIPHEEKQKEAPKRASQVYDDSNESNLQATATTTLVSKGETDQKVNRIEINILEGNLNYIPSTESIKLHPGDTVSIQGLGPYLSRKYYVKSVERTIGPNGYSHSANVMCPAFNDKLKGTTTTGDETAPETQKPNAVSEQASNNQGQTTYTVKKGDCLWSIAREQYGAGTEWEKIYDANSGQIADPNLIYEGQVLVLP